MIVGTWSSLVTVVFLVTVICVPDTSFMMWLSLGRWSSGSLYSGSSAVTTTVESAGAGSGVVTSEKRVRS